MIQFVNTEVEEERGKEEVKENQEYQEEEGEEE